MPDHSQRGRGAWASRNKTQGSASRYLEGRSSVPQRQALSAESMAQMLPMATTEASSQRLRTDTRHSRHHQGAPSKAVSNSRAAP